MTIPQSAETYTADDVVIETRAFNEQLRKELAASPPMHTQEPGVIRRERLEGTDQRPAPVYLPEGRNEQVPGRHGPITVRVFVPDQVDGVYLYYHGGGWMLGGADQQDPQLWDLASAASVAVVSVEYRLAPEHPFPAGLDDCEDAAVWLVGNGRDRFGTDRFVIGGASAGAHLAVTTLLRLRSRRGTTAPFGAANLVYGVYDLGMTPSQRLFGDEQLGLSTPTMAWFYDAFVPGTTAEQRRNPEISPLYANLDRMPPARFVVGTMDPLLDDTLFMEARWRTAGAPTRLEVVPGGVHGFTRHPLTIARVARQQELEFVKESVAP
jgi:acetyl esterase/lipase